MPDSNIANWNVSTLTKFIRDVLLREPQRFAQALTVEELTVVRQLTVSDEVEFAASSDFRVVGNTGQPAFANSWTHYGAPYSKAAYIKLPDGFVLLTGVIKSGTVGSPAFTLPPGFRPAVAPGPFIVYSQNANSVGRVDIGTDGTVTPVAPSANAAVSLEGIRFKAA